MPHRLYEVQRIELEQVIASFVTSETTTFNEVVEDYSDGGAEWTSGGISF